MSRKSNTTRKGAKDKYQLAGASNSFPSNVVSQTLFLKYACNMPFHDLYGFLPFKHFVTSKNATLSNMRARPQTPNWTSSNKQMSLVFL
jgi:hypothetical protein